ncbi:hypothetical protein TRFO_41574 [Tritrichomonas foetus]|uniref:Uncharacterized protein n=1 Tax=Tritrichomonas foetus TaxID=1144522 RepID=A0A1J4L4B9_9EUKA|nr:hypothetical protein TRFO_41574 [Tritrichomonas foetus]|eukprot:OHT16773.1 hypothetical protein TRFO_41574 [Tritrichomonas foetus]
MTLLFNSTKVLDNKSLLGCVQINLEPESYLFFSQAIKKCPKCKCPLFPLKNEKDTDCPICHPDSDFSNGSYQFGPKSIPRNHFFFIFDIEMPQNKLIAYLTELYNSITDDDTISIVCMANNAIFASVKNGLLIFDIYDNPNFVEMLKQYVIEREWIQSVVIPSITSIYALRPAELNPVCDPFFGLRCSLKAASKRPVAFFLFFYRKICDLQVSDAEALGEAVSEAKSIVHIGGPPEFRRYSAVTRYSFGSVFGTADLPASIVRKIVFMSRPSDRTRFYAPRCVTFTKTTGCSGSVNTKEFITKLKLNSMVGGSIRFQCEENKNHIHTRFLESVRTRNGTFLTVHTLHKNAANVNENITISLLLKGFASDVLRAAWDGEDFKRTIKEKLTDEIKQAITGTCLADIGNNLQIDVFRLYYVLLNFGKCNLLYHLKEMPDCSIIIAPPVLYVLKKLDNFQIDEIFNQNLWPFYINVVTPDEFKDMCNKYIISD